tara:strand:- start:1961 stop:2710 length:750 start_codon:yes stop_codon:yes gene_type:complete
MDFEFGFTGYEPRDYQEVPFGSVFDSAEYQIELLDRKHWWELWRESEAAESTPAHRHKKHCQIFSQGAFPFCWGWAASNAVMNLQSLRLDQPRLLNGHSTACWRTGYKKRGGYGAEACKAVSDFGVAEFDLWPEYSMNKKLAKSRKVLENAAKNKLVSFYELPRPTGDWVVSSLLQGYPVVSCFSWWRHAVLAVGLRFKSQQAAERGEYELLVANSWGERWGDGGYGWLTGSKRFPTEALVATDLRLRK